MKILVVGAGGREHALAWRLKRDAAGNPVADRDIVVTPGNAGIAREFRCEPLRGDGVAGVVRLARDERPDLVVIGPEAWLTAGLVDALSAAGIPAFGPTQAAAKIEGSKALMKQVCARAGVATAGFVVTTRAHEARRFVEERARAKKSVVVKADGLCAGKGVIVCRTPQEAVAAVDEMLGVDSGKPRFGEASRTIVVEDLLPGEELSIFALCDGNDAVLFGAARDHKRLLDGEQGPNTGGMGAVAFLGEREGVPPQMLARIRETVFLPVLDELRARGAPFRGLLFAGLMVHDGEPKVLEFNARFGDPETEAVMLAVDVDLVPLLVAATSGTLPKTSLAQSSRKAAVVVVAAAGYPENPKTGATIQGLEEAERVEGVKVFCAGVARDGERLFASGGRICAVSGFGSTFAEATDRAYAGVDKLRIEGAQFRRDIGKSVRER